MKKKQIESLKNFKKDHSEKIGPVFVREEDNEKISKIFFTTKYQGNLIRVGKNIVDGQCERKKTKRGRVKVLSGKLIPINDREIMVGIMIMKESISNAELNKYGLRLLTDKETGEI